MRLALARWLLRSQLRSFERKIQPSRFDPVLSARIDRVRAALEALG